jgi:hypothetical protein
MKKVFLSICTGAVIAVAGVNVYISLSDNVKLSGLMLTNILALGQGEVFEPGCGATKIVTKDNFMLEGNKYTHVSTTTEKSCWKGSDSSCEEGKQVVNVNNSVIDGSFTIRNCN